MPLGSALIGCIVALRISVQMGKGPSPGLDTHFRLHIILLQKEHKNYLAPFRRKLYNLQTISWLLLAHYIVKRYLLEVCCPYLNGLMQQSILLSEAAGRLTYGGSILFMLCSPSYSAELTRLTSFPLRAVLSSQQSLNSFS